MLFWYEEALFSLLRDTLGFMYLIFYIAAHRIDKHLGLFAKYASYNYR